MDCRITVFRVLVVLISTLLLVNSFLVKPCNLLQLMHSQMECRTKISRMLLVLVTSIATLLQVNRSLLKPGNLQQLTQLDGMSYHNTASTGQT